MVFPSFSLLSFASHVIITNLSSLSLEPLQERLCLNRFCLFLTILMVKIEYWRYFLFAALQSSLSLMSIVFFVNVANSHVSIASGKANQINYM